PRDAALPYEVADEDIGKQVRVDVPAAQQGRDFLALVALRLGEHRRKAGGAGAFDDGLLDAHEHRHGALEMALGNEHYVVGIFPKDPRRELARLLDRNPFGERVAAK